MASFAPLGWRAGKRAGASALCGSRDGVDEGMYLTVLPHLRGTGAFPAFMPRTPLSGQRLEPVDVTDGG